MKRRQQALILGAFFANCWGFSTAYASLATSPSLPRDSLVYCTSVSGFSFNPQKAQIGSNVNVVTDQIYEKLFDVDPKHQLLPALAERFEVSEDGLSITLFLRKQVAFHDTPWFSPTRAFNAEDVLFSLNRILGKESMELLNVESQNGKEGDSSERSLSDRIHFPYFERVELSSKIAEISALSESVVHIRLHRPDSAFLTHLASPFAVMLSKEYALQLLADDNLAQLDLMPVGTGVYQLENYVQNGYVRLKAHPHYWGNKAQIPQMVVDFSTTATGRMAKFLNGECDVSAFPEPAHISLIGSKKGYVVEQKGANLAYLAFNFDRPIGKDIALRQRITQAIDRRRLAKTFFYGRAEVAQNVLPPALFVEPNPNIEAYHFSNVDSTQVISEPLVLWVVDEQRVYHQHPLKMAEFVRAELVKAGIPVRVQVVSRAYLTQQLDLGLADYDLILSGWLAGNFESSGFLSPILACQAQYSVSNLANWCDREFDALLAQARVEENDSARQALYRQMQQRLEQHLPLIPLVNVNRVLLVKNRVENAQINPFGQVKLSEMRFK